MYLSTSFLDLIYIFLCFNFYQSGHCLHFDARTVILINQKGCFRQFVNKILKKKRFLTQVLSQDVLKAVVHSLLSTGWFQEHIRA